VRFKKPNKLRFYWVSGALQAEIVSLWKISGMKKALLFMFMLGAFTSLVGQTKKESDPTHGALINDVGHDLYQSTDTIKAPAAYDNIYNRALYNDTLASSFVIFVKKEVKEHKHEKHAEHVVVLEGEAIMKVDGKSFGIKKGDIIFIPKNTWHYVKVTSKVPLKVLSLQAPNFDGKDRVLR
jgi:mannose-6-phosphate isomerase-like protein (cupin superfamily)